MRYEYTVERDKSSTRLGLRLLGTRSPATIPISILEIQRGGLIDVTNQWRLLGPRFVPVLEPGDIILSANGSSKQVHGMEIVWIALRQDRRVVLEMFRHEHDPWDIGILGGAPAPPPGPPPELVGSGSWVRTIDVDPLQVRFTHDNIRSHFRNGNSVDMTIGDLLSGKLKKHQFPALEVSRDSIGKRDQGGRCGDRGR